MKHFECQKVLNRKLSEFAKSKKIDIAYPNIEYEPNIKKTWLKLFYLPTYAENIFFGKNREQIHGIMQVDIYTPRDSGTEKAYKLAEELQDVFGVNSVVTSEDGFVRIIDFDLTSMQENDWFRVMCEIHYTSFN